MRLSVRVVPNARITTLAEKRADEWVLRVNARAIEGKANDAAMEFLARALGVRRSAVTLVAGEKSRHKIFEIVGLDRIDVERKLAEQPR
jgi:uncharacterized protein YggU (UPF0235/DUF167 family)